MEKTMDQILAKVEADNKREEAKTKPKTGDALKAEADFLKRWCKKKPIVRQHEGSTFWAAGKWMTKLAWPTVNALVAAGYATVDRDPKETGARMVML